MATHAIFYNDSGGELVDVDYCCDRTCMLDVLDGQKIAYGFVIDADSACVLLPGPPLCLQHRARARQDRRANGTHEWNRESENVGQAVPLGTSRTLLRRYANEQPSGNVERKTT